MARLKISTSVILIHSVTMIGIGLLLGTQLASKQLHTETQQSELNLTQVKNSNKATEIENLTPVNGATSQCIKQNIKKSVDSMEPKIVEAYPNGIQFTNSPQEVNGILLNLSPEEYENIVAEYHAAQNQDNSTFDYQSKIEDFSYQFEGVILQSVECYVQSCQIFVQSDNQETFQNFYRALSQQNWWNSIGYQVVPTEPASMTNRLLLVMLSAPINEQRSEVAVLETDLNSEHR